MSDLLTMTLTLEHIGQNFADEIPFIVTKNKTDLFIKLFKFNDTIYTDEIGFIPPPFNFVIAEPLISRALIKAELELDPAWIYLGKTQVNFKKILKLGDKIFTEVTIEKIEANITGQAMTLLLKQINDDDEEIMNARLTFSLGENSLPELTESDTFNDDDLNLFTHKANTDETLSQAFYIASTSKGKPNYTGCNFSVVTILFNEITKRILGGNSTRLKTIEMQLHSPCLFNKNISFSAKWTDHSNNDSKNIISHRILSSSFLEENQNSPFAIAKITVI